MEGADGFDACIPFEVFEHLVVVCVERIYEGFASGSWEQMIVETMHLPCICEAAASVLQSFGDIMLESSCVCEM